MTQSLDELFGLRSIKVGNTTLTVRKVLSRKQKRAINHARSKIRSIEEQLRNMDASDRNPEAETDLEEKICDAYGLILRQFIVTALPYDELSLDSLQMVLGELNSARTQEDEDSELLRSTGFPTNAP